MKESNNMNLEFSPELMEKLGEMRKEMLERLKKRKEQGVHTVIEKDWMIDDSELNYIEVPVLKENIFKNKSDN